MAAPRFLRALPSIAVGVLVVAAAAAQSDPSSPLRRLLPAPRGTFAKPAASGAAASGPREGASPAAVNAISCYVLTPTATTGRPPFATVWQPDVVTATASGLSFSLLSGSGAATTFTAEIAFFDPNSTDPRMSIYALHRSTLTASGTGLESIGCPIDRPIVIRRLEGDPVTLTVGLALRSDSPDPVEDAYEPNGPARFRPAMYEAGAIGFVPLPGPNPVLAHEVCGEMDAGDGLHVVRQLLASNVTVSASLEMVQTFETAVTATAEWVELAVAAPPGSPVPLDVRIFELGGTVPPVDPLPATSTAAVMEGATLAPPVWGATVPLAEPARLEPGRRYALAIVCDGTWSFGAAAAPDGSAYEGGELWTRNGPGGPFTLDSDRDLSFRVIGRPVTQTADPELPVCDGVLSRSSTRTASMPLPADRVVVQPLTIKGDNFGIGSVFVYAGGPITVPADPDLELSLAPFGAPPIPNQIALRAGGVTVCSTCPPVGDLRELPLTAPLVTTPLEGVAQGAGQQLVMALRGRGATATVEVRYDEASSLAIPPALYRDPGFPWTQLPGPYAVLAHQICPATPTASGPWRVAQQVLQADGVFHGTLTAKLLQSFRVPSTVQVSWAELGLRFGGAPTHTAVPVRLLAPGPGTQTAEPDVEIGAMAVPITVTAGTGGPVVFSALHPSSPLPAFVTLTAGVDYWIQVTTTAEADYVYGEASGYTEGRLFRSPAPGAPPVEETDRDLAFRLIGVPRELMAGPVTHTCNGCQSRVFDAVTVTADFRGVTITARSFGQVLPITTTPILESVQLPLGADGDPVTITADLRFTETDAFGRVTPRDDSYPLHNVTITASGGDMRWGQAFFDRPLVMRGWGGLTPTGTAGVGIVVHPPDAAAKGRAKIALGDVDVCTCTALEERVAGGGGGGGGGWSPLPGLAMGHALHGVTTTADLDLHQMAGELNVHGVTITASDVVQTFRVPTATRVEWVELAVPAGQPESPPFEVSIVDPGTLPAPRVGPLGATTTAEPLGFSESMRLGGTWAPTGRFASPPVLQPGRDYWLVARVPASWSLARAVTATATHGPRLYTRPPGDGDWTEEPSGALSFRVIGAATNPVDVPAVTGAQGLRLSASPLPFRHELALRWLGGSGRMTVEIFDERGRRVRQVRDAGAAVYGAWTWRGEDDSGRRVGAGVYFVRATPGTGPAVRQRVVFLR